MGVNLSDIHDGLKLRRTMELFDDFKYYTSGNNDWTSILAGAATIAVNDGEGGILTMSAIDSTLNREVYLKSTFQVFKMVNNNPIVVEAFIQYTEANTNKANIAFGLMSSVAAASILDNTGEPKTSFSGAIIYKVPGGTQWKTASSLGTTQNVNQSNTTAGGASYSRLRIDLLPVSSTVMEATYRVDGVQLRVANARTPIKDSFTYTGALNMNLFVCLKNGSTTPEILNIDYIAAEQLRATFTT